LAHALPCPVVATTRSGTWGGATTPSHVTLSALDVTDRAADFRCIEAASSVVIAFAPARVSGAPVTDAARHALYMEGTRAVVRALPPATRLVFVGSTSALAAHDGWVDETCDAPPQTTRGRAQRAAEAIVLGRAAPSIVLRMGGLIGPGRGLDRLYRSRPQTEPRPGDGMSATNLIHQDDAVAAVVAALTRPNVRGVVHVVADGHVARRTMYREIASRAGVEAPRWAEAPKCAAVHGKRVSNARLKLALGVRLRHPLAYPWLD